MGLNFFFENKTVACVKSLSRVAPAAAGLACSGPWRVPEGGVLRPCGPNGQPPPPGSDASAHSPGPSPLVLRYGRVSQKGVMRVGRWTSRGNEDSSPHFSSVFLTLLGLYGWSYIPLKMSDQCRWCHDAAPPPFMPKEGQNREIKRKRGKK